MNDQRAALTLAQALADLDQAALDVQAPVFGEYAGGLLDGQDSSLEGDQAWAYKQCGTADTWQKAVWLVEELTSGDFDAFRMAIELEAECIVDTAETFLDRYRDYEDEYDNFYGGDVRAEWRAARARLDFLLAASHTSPPPDDQHSPRENVCRPLLLASVARLTTRSVGSLQRYLRSVARRLTHPRIESPGHPKDLVPTCPNCLGVRHTLTDGGN